MNTRRKCGLCDEWCCTTPTEKTPKQISKRYKGAGTMCNDCFYNTMRKTTRTIEVTVDLVVLDDAAHRLQMTEALNGIGITSGHMNGLDRISIPIVKAIVAGKSSVEIRS